jgi:hypothetical protein
MDTFLVLTKSGRGLSILILGKLIAKIADLGSKKAGLSSDFWGNCMILKKNFNLEEAYFRSLLYK